MDIVVLNIKVYNFQIKKGAYIYFMCTNILTFIHFMSIFESIL